MTKLVQLSDEAYRRLQSLKKRDESFSDVVIRLVRRGSLADLSKLGRSDREIQEHRRWIHEIDRLDRAA